ncbi:pyridoxamine 5'-phosphate oxidase family protein [Motiliproteus sediminis]|uniref:pyridoxamine 5'-phosphate oxidase family protein n=1 Tax=Motiliproteus sediminis TaxID=1468178 RepID=UPI001AEF9190
MSADSESAPGQGQDLAAVAKEAGEFADRFNSVLLGAVGNDGYPVMGYAPCVRDDQRHYFLLVSDLAAHTAALLQQQQAELLWIEEEVKARNPFARRRLTMRCKVAAVNRSSGLYEQRLIQLQQRFGETVAVLRGLADFRLLQLTPVAGRYVVGFGRAYAIAPQQGGWLASGPLRPATDPD